VLRAFQRASASGTDLPADAAGQRVTAILDDLDGIISGIRDSVFAARARAALPPERHEQIDQEERSRPTLSRP
jgi:hypothetical protein